jgi:hypothetical protein
MKVEGYLMKVQEDSSGELFLEFPDDLLEQMRWKPGDNLVWTPAKNGAWLLAKLEVE